MNYRKLFIAAVLLNIALGAAVYWISRSSQPAATEQAPVEHSPMEGFSTGTPPEGTAPPLTRIELTPERMQSIGVRTGHVAAGAGPLPAPVECFRQRQPGGRLQ